tara:strand:- start:2961 stop:3650 length:690 start_codon:yes stop_codon:yes gene_type:complete
MVSIIGPNGSGKTTMVKLISNEIEASSGRVLFQNKNIINWDINELACSRSVLSQSNSLTFPFSVLDIVKMGRYPLKNKLNKSLEDELYNTILDIFDLNNYTAQNYITLSGGEKQRVQLARSIAQIWSVDYSDKLLILDEPTSYLDIKHQQALFSFLKLLNSKGLTIIMVLHDLNHAISNSNKIILLKNSQLISFCNTKDIINKNVLNKVFEIDLKLINYDGLDIPFISQ